MNEEKKEDLDKPITKKELLEILKDLQEKNYQVMAESFKIQNERITKMEEALNTLFEALKKQVTNQQVQQPQQANLVDQLAMLMQLAKMFGLGQNPNKEVEALKDKVFRSWLLRKDIIEKVNEKLMKKSIEKLLGEEAKDILKDLEEKEE